jgi:hypothetical protein
MGFVAVPVQVKRRFVVVCASAVEIRRMRG